MNTNVHKTALLGDLIAAVFDEAACYSTDPNQVSRLATQAVLHILQLVPMTRDLKVSADITH